MNSANTTASETGSGRGTQQPTPPKVRRIEDVERDQILIAVAHYNMVEAAKLLGIGRSTLYRKLARYAQ